MKLYEEKIFSLEEKPKIYEILKTTNIILEIGSGNGAFLEHLGKTFRDKTVIGVELDIKRAKKCKRRIERNNLENTLILSGNAMEIIPLFFRDNSVEKTYMNFPEPWPKSSNWRNRLFEIGFLSMLDRITKPKGHFHLATDVENAFLTTNEILTEILGNWAYNANLSEEYKNSFIPTLYYEKWLSEGRTFWWGVWEKKC
ncbi:MAG: methyltransferase domain-containing protein [Brevinematia bacterium]